MRGTSGEAVLVGNSGCDVIDGRRGTDVIRGRAGDDELGDYRGVGTGGLGTPAKRSTVR